MNKFVIEDLYHNKLYYFCGIESPQIHKHATVTQYSTSSGTKISDNSYVEPKAISFTLYLSDIASNTQKVLDNSTQRLNELSRDTIQNVVNEWMDTAIRLNITSFTTHMENMILEDISYPEKALGIYQPTLSFIEVRQANADYITIKFPRNSKELASGSGEQNIGANNGISAGDVGAVVGTTASGALVGAAIGSVIPGIGTAAGAVIGGVYGLFQGLIGW